MNTLKLIITILLLMITSNDKINHRYSISIDSKLEQLSDEQLMFNEKLSKVYESILNKESTTISFIKYIKTQSGRLDDSLNIEDTYYVIQVMINRLMDSDVTWTKYFNTPSINHSRSIKLMKQGILNPPFYWKNDWRLVKIIKDLQEYKVPRQLLIPRNILYFESFRRCPNRAPHFLSKLYVKKVHKFYSK